MALSYKTRKRLALLILVVGVPAYIVSAVTVMGWLQGPDMSARPSIWVELGVYLGLGILWALPFRSIFRGIGQDPPAEEAAAPRTERKDDL